MMRIIIFAVLILVGGAAGIGAGFFLRPAPEVTDNGDAAKEKKGDDHDEKGDDASKKDKGDKDDYGDGDAAEDGANTDIVKLTNQFVVPILDQQRVTAMVVLSLSLETEAGSQEFAFQREPKIRDAMLQVLFDHANSGGFSNNFTSGDRLDRLRDLLRAATRPVLGDIVLNVLVTDIARQDM